MPLKVTKRQRSDNENTSPNLQASKKHNNQESPLQDTQKTVTLIFLCIN